VFKNPIMHISSKLDSRAFIYGHWCGNGSDWAYRQLMKLLQRLWTIIVDSTQGMTVRDQEALLDMQRRMTQSVNRSPVVRPCTQHQSPGIRTIDPILTPVCSDLCRPLSRSYCLSRALWSVYIDTQQIRLDEKRTKSRNLEFLTKKNENHNFGRNLDES